MAEARVAGSSTLDMSTAPVALENSPPPAKDEKVAKKTIKHMKERAKDTFGVVLRGDLVWRMLEKGKGSKAPSSAELTPFAASKDAIQRSRLARESTELREKEEADRAKRLAEREASRESQRRARGDSSVSNLSTTFRSLSFMPRRPSNLAKVEVSDLRPVTSEPAEAEMRPFTFEQAIRHGQQHGRGVESVAEEILTRDNSVANMGGIHEETTTQPNNVVKKAHSSHQLMPVETPAVTAEGNSTAVLEVVKAEDIRATKSAVDLRDGVEERNDSGRGSMGTNSLDSVRRVGVLGVRKKVSVASSRYSQPEAGVVVEVRGKADEEEGEEGLTMAVAAAEVVA
ncbi:MAG: hypothetical protein Q9188_005419 [Gyalolechia gomerana]